MHEVRDSRGRIVSIVISIVLMLAIVLGLSFIVMLLALTVRLEL
jgi:hypothetical protein